MALPYSGIASKQCHLVNTSLSFANTLPHSTIRGVYFKQQICFALRIYARSPRKSSPCLGYFFKRVLPGCHSRGRSRGCVEIAIEDSTNMRRSTFSALGPLNKTDLAWDRRYTKGEVRGSDAEQVGDGQNSTQNGTRADNRTQETFSLRLPCYNHCCHKAMAHHSCN